MNVGSWERNQGPHDHDRFQRRLNNNELSLFQSIRNVSYNDDYTDDILSVPQNTGSYRIYVGIVLVIMLGAVAYMAWRGAQVDITVIQRRRPFPSRRRRRSRRPRHPFQQSVEFSPVESSLVESSPVRGEHELAGARNATEPVRTKPDRSAASTTADTIARLPAARDFEAREKPRPRRRQERAPKNSPSPNAT